MNVYVYIIIAIICGVLFFIGLIFYNSKASMKWERRENTKEGAAGHWYGPVYMNRDDPRIFIPNQYGDNRTVNIGNPVGMFFGIVLIGVIVWIIFILITQ